MTDLHAVEEDPRLAALLRWRNELIEAGAVSRSSFKEAHVRLVLRSGRTEVDEIRAMLPGAVAKHAEQMARVLRDASAPAPLPAAKDNAAGPDSTAAASVPHTGFARYKFHAGEHEICPLALRRVPGSTEQGAALEVSWPPYIPKSRKTARHVIYRLVSTEDDPGYSPDSGCVVQATTGTTVIDRRPVTRAVRHLQVWANAGTSATDALAAQPVLHATGVVIGTPREVEIREDSGRVIGRWAALPGVRAVRVYRIPVELAEHDGPAFRIAADQANLTGFADHDAERGRRYVYRLRSEVEVEGVLRLSEAVQFEIRVSAVREPVTDLRLTMHGEGHNAVFDLQWTTPRFGQVLVFRTSDSPSADAHGVELEETVLDQVGLTRDALLTHPMNHHVDQSGARRSVMAGVPWPPGWNRAYFTPVTVLDGRARLGKPISTVRTGVITDVSLMQYCNKQVLTFDWPAGAASVLVFIAPKGHDPRDGLTGRSYEIALADYEKYGGMQFLGNLPNAGCSLHLVPVAFSGGRRVLGVPVSIEYGGLLRLWYDVHVLRDGAGLPVSAAIRMLAESETTGSPPFVLVNNPDRIPLTVNDGDAVDVFPVDAQGRPISARSKELQWSTLPVMDTEGEGEVWVGDVQGRRGWIRLFANLPPARLRLLALLDPPVEALRLTHPGMLA